MEGYQDMIRAVEAISPVPIELEEIAGDSKGYYDREAKRIAVQENMSESQTLKTMIHEVFYPQLGVKLCSMAGGGVQKIYMVFFKRTVPAGQVRQ